MRRSTGSPRSPSAILLGGLDQAAEPEPRGGNESAVAVTPIVPATNAASTSGCPGARSTGSIAYGIGDQVRRARTGASARCPRGDASRSKATAAGGDPRKSAAATKVPEPGRIARPHRAVPVRGRPLPAAILRPPRLPRDRPASRRSEIALEEGARPSREAVERLQTCAPPEHRRRYAGEVYPESPDHQPGSFSHVHRPALAGPGRPEFRR